MYISLCVLIQLLQCFYAGIETKAAINIISIIQHKTSRSVFEVKQVYVVALQAW